jgi:prepilin-type N-terminal cleavage/methylation domain-containing protein
MKKQGFSLVELSIVLVILGLLTGGILTGQNLIRAAELRSVTTQIAGYRTALYSFRDKYFAIPGDMVNATNFWGEAHATPATCQTTASTGVLTCNGNGNGQIGETGGWRWERFRAWQHMANAGLIEGTYNGIAGPSGVNHAQIGLNVPRAKMTNAGWNLLADNPGEDNKLTIGTESTSGTAFEAFILPEEAWGLDKKVDDGLPETGRVQSLLSGCVDASTPANYALTVSSVECNLQFLNLY